MSLTRELIYTALFLAIFIKIIIFFYCFFVKNFGIFVVSLQREPPQCPPRPASYTPSSNNEPPGANYSAAIALNNLDTLRSYGSAGDELENFPPDYLRNLNRSTPVPPTSSALSKAIGAGSDADSLHKPSWQEQMQLASFITDTAKIKNGMYDCDETGWWESLDDFDEISLWKRKFFLLSWLWIGEVNGFYDDSLHMKQRKKVKWEKISSK